MKPSPTLRSVWDSIPDVECKGLCWQYCGPVAGCSEEESLLAANGVNLADIGAVLAGNIDSKACPALVDRRCSVYEVRPTICRLFGAAEGLECPFGCQPARGLLPRQDARFLVQLLERKTAP